MTTALLMYLCLAFDKNGCSPQEAWLVGYWEGPTAVQICDEAAVKTNAAAEAEGYAHRMKFVCESVSTEKEDSHADSDFDA